MLLGPYTVNGYPYVHTLPMSFHIIPDAISTLIYYIHTVASRRKQVSIH